MFSSTRSTRRSSFRRSAMTRDLLDFAAAISLGAFVFGALVFACFLQMAVHVAQGNSLHIGADIFFAAYSSGQLAVIACTAGAISLAGIIGAGLCAIVSKNL